jgi:two-component system, OmpR family, sensor histidine kinase KdpD
MEPDKMAEDKALSFLRLIRRAQRGKLKIYLGYGAGVGKTWQMLQEGHRLKEEGVDIVVGLVETHGRVETGKLLEGLEVVPRRQVQYRGITLEEMDLDAVLARRPEVALVDELAHSNVPGSKNRKRYQDVEDLLAAGIHVISTVNIQHLESLYDLVETHIGVKVHERIPDTVLAEADEIINVDISPGDLLRRLREGKIYPPERVAVALENFFKRVNLDQLRELTLRELASQIDLKRRTEPEENPEAAPEQVMVCISSRGPNAAALLRYGSRIAGRLNTAWYAVYVQTPREASTIIDAATQRQLSDSLTLAKQLGAMVFPYKGEDIVATILHFAREYRVSHIIIGKPGRLPAWKRWLGRKTVAEQLIFEAPPGVTIVVRDTSSFLF